MESKKVQSKDTKTLDIEDYINSQPVSRCQVVGYIRVSSAGQNMARQLDGVALDMVFKESVTGSKINRPELNKLIAYVRTGDTVLVHSLDRLARDLSNLITIVTTLNNKGVTLKSLKENLSFNASSQNSLDKFLLHVLGAVAEFQRSLIKEAQLEGIRKAKLRGAFKGRKPALSNDQIKELGDIVELKNSSLKEWKNTTWRDIAKQFNVSEPTILRYVKNIKQGEIL